MGTRCLISKLATIATACHRGIILSSTSVQRHKLIQAYLPCHLHIYLWRLITNLALKDPHIKMNVFQPTLNCHPSQTRGKIHTMLFTSHMLWKALLCNELVLEVQPRIPVQEFKDFGAHGTFNRMLNTMLCARLIVFKYLKIKLANFKNSSLSANEKHKEEYENHHSPCSRENTMP